MNYHTVENCRLCASPKLEDILSVCEQRVVEWGNRTPVTVPLEVVKCEECDLLQLRHTTNPDLLWGENYGYKSGVNQTMRDHLRGIVESTGAKEGDLVVDIGCNDGTLLSNYPEGVTRVGFEPSRNVGMEAWDKGNVDKLFLDFFSAFPFVQEYGEHKADVITAISMFYDLDDPNAFVNDIKRCLKKDGTFIVQQNYLGGMLEQNAVDNICHEHVEYYSLKTMQNLLNRHDMEVYKVEFNDLNGGSFRTFISNKGEKEIDPSVNLKEDFDYSAFAERSRENADQLHDFIEGENAKGKRTYVYGASTRGNTLMQFAHLEGLIPKAMERNPDKYGKDYNGAEMISEHQGRDEKPDYLLMLPWFFAEEFVQREKALAESGTKFIIPLPRMKIL